MMPQTPADPPSTERDPLALVRPYIVDPSPRIRGNAACALAALAESSDDAARLLASQVIGEEDGPLQLRIFREIAGLNGNARLVVIKALHGLLLRGDLQSRASAFKVMSHLQGIGVELPAVSLRDADRAARVGLANQESRDARSVRLPLVVSAMLSALISAFVALTVATTRATNVLDSANGLGLVWAQVAVAAAIVAFIATRFTTPAYLQLSRPAGAVWDALLAAIVTFFVSATLLLMVVIATDLDIAVVQLLLTVGGAAAGLALTVGGVRVGTLAVADQPLIAQQKDLALWDEGRLSRWAKLTIVGQVAMGVVAGVAIAIAAGWILVKLLVHDPLSHTILILDAMSWLSLVATLPVAVAFAVIDRPVLLIDWLALEIRERTPTALSGAPDPAPGSGEALPSTRRIWVKAAQGLALVALVLGVALIWRPASRENAIPTFDSTEPTTSSRWFVGIPARFEFALEFLQDFKAEISDDALARDLKMTLSGWAPTPSAADQPVNCGSGIGRSIEVETVDEPERIERRLGRGCYALEIQDFDDGALASGGGRLFGGVGAMLEALAQSRATFDSSATPENQELRITANSGRFKPGDPFTSTGDGVETDWWSVYNIPEERAIEVKRPTALVATITPPRAQVEAGGGSGRDRDVAYRLTLVSGVDVVASGQTLNTLVEEGTYKLVVDATEAKPGPAVVSVAGGPSVLNYDRSLPNTAALTTGLDVGKEKTGHWNFAELPARFDFRIRTSQIVRASLPLVTRKDPFNQDATPTDDVVLILEKDGRNIASDDSDPEVLAQRLDPGYYAFRIERPSRRAASPLGSVTKMWLELEFGLTEMPPPRPPKPPSRSRPVAR